MRTYYEYTTITHLGLCRLFIYFEGEIMYIPPIDGLVITPSKMFPYGIFIGDTLILDGEDVVTVVTWEEAQAAHKGDSGWAAPMSSLYIRYCDKECGNKYWGCVIDLITKVVRTRQETNGQLLMF